MSDAVAKEVMNLIAVVFGGGVLLAILIGIFVGLYYMIFGDEDG